MKKVYSLREAQEWFIGNATGAVICVREGDEETCASFPQAEDFYNRSKSQRSTYTDDDSNTSLLTNLAIMESSLSSFDTSPDPTPDTSSSFDSGGGDFGGAGAGSDY